MNVSTQHDGVDDESHYVLQDEDSNGRQAVLCYHPTSKADGHLNLDGEQEGWDKRPGKRENTEKLRLFKQKIPVTQIRSLV